MYRSEYIVCFRSEISFVPLLFSHRTPFLRPYWQIYFNSTSNHNTLQNYHNAYGVVSYFHFTSNHNIRLFRHRFIRLFLISILHQTTTSDMRFVDCHSVIWPNERYERRMTGRGSRNDAGFDVEKSQSKIKIWSLLERETDSSVTGI